MKEVRFYIPRVVCHFVVYIVFVIFSSYMLCQDYPISAFLSSDFTTTFSAIEFAWYFIGFLTCAFGFILTWAVLQFIPFMMFCASLGELDGDVF